MEIKARKEELRGLIREKERQLHPGQKLDESQVIRAKIELSETFRRARVVLAYWPLPDEVRIEPLIIKWRQEKIFLLPVIEGDNLKLRCFTGISKLKTNSRFGIKEPTGSLFDNHGQIDLALIPGVAFDTEGYRLGRGQGYYDRLLPSLVGACLTGVCFSCQIVEMVPREIHDIKMDMVLSP